MNPETLEGLLIDQALGELTPEVEALLDAYLAANPVAAKHAATCAQAWRMAKEATAFERDAQVHPLPLAQSRRKNPWTWKAHRAELLRSAACLAVGVATGWALFSAQFTRPGAPSDVKQPTTFWSKTHLVEKYHRRSASKRRPVRYELRWGSSVSMQRVEESHETSSR